MKSGAIRKVEDTMTINEEQMVALWDQELCF